VGAVLTAERVDCGQSSAPLQLGDVGSSGVVHLSSSLVSPSETSDAGCGSDAAPWLISDVWRRLRQWRCSVVDRCSPWTTSPRHAAGLRRRCSADDITQRHRAARLHVDHLGTDCLRHHQRCYRLRW